MALDGQWVSGDPTRLWARGPANFILLIFAYFNKPGVSSPFLDRRPVVIRARKKKFASCMREAASESATKITSLKLAHLCVCIYTPYYFPR